ncbi:MAG: hypothetical protein ABIV10_16015 [Gemmatimonadaceae bacterium]
MRRLFIALMVPCLASAADGQRPLGERRGDAPRRAQMERQFQRNLWQIAQRQIGFTDEQMARLQQTSRRFDERRRALAVEERTLRATLRRELSSDAQSDGSAARSADQAVVASTLDRVHELQRERVELQIEEQRAFAAFMSPVQRARYAALQEHVRRRVEALRRERPDSIPPRRR